jgi:hypothetical protein
MAADELLNFHGKQVFEKTKIAASYHDRNPLTGGRTVNISFSMSCT